MLSSYLTLLANNNALSHDESSACLNTIFDHDLPDEQIIELLTALSDKGETVEELTGFASAMRERAHSIDIPSPCIDMCGTGGSGKDRFNVSTSAAFIVSSLGIPVAKHGNRGSKKSNGSFDFLEALGVSFEVPTNQLSSLFDQTHLCFLFARQHHPSVGKVAAARKAIGKRTIFNLLGPLCNPAHVTHHVLGTTSFEAGALLAKTLHRLGTQKSLVIVGHGGLDELSSTGPSTLFDVTSEGVSERIFDPETIGLPQRSETDIQGGTAKENAAVFTELFSTGNTTSPISELICLNAGAAIYCMGKTNRIGDGFKLAQTTLQSGRAWDHFNTYKDLSQRLSVR